MATKVIMPKQGLQMTEGTILKWLVQEGGACTEGEPLFEMETDKLTITIDAPATGTLLKIVREEGEAVPITHTIGIIGQPGESFELPEEEEAEEKVPAEEAPKSQPEAPKAAARQEGERVFSSPRARWRAEERGIRIQDVPGTGPEGMIVERDVLGFTVAKATPLARTVARQNDVDLASLEGTGSHGKIVKDDVLASLAQKVEERKVLAPRGETLLPMEGMRKVIATRMKQSQETNASLTHTIRVDMSNATELRQTYKAMDKKISFNDIILLAAVRALKDFPIMNSSVTEAGILVKDYVNLGVAVALDEGLIVPNIKDADLMRLEELSLAAKTLAEKAKTNRLTPDEYANGTFTISNLGMFGLDHFEAIINPPEAGILAIGAITKTPVVVEDQIVIRPMMSVTLTYDHRVVDGAPAARFLQRVQQYLEHPCLML